MFLQNIIDLVNFRYKQRERERDFTKIKESHASFTQFIENLDISDKKQYDLKYILDISLFYERINKCLMNGQTQCNLKGLNSIILCHAINYETNEDFINIQYLTEKYKADNEFKPYIISEDENGMDLKLNEPIKESLCKKFSDYMNAVYGYGPTSGFSNYKYTCINDKYNMDYCDITVNLEKMC